MIFKSFAEVNGIKCNNPLITHPTDHMDLRRFNAKAHAFHNDARALPVFVPHACVDAQSEVQGDARFAVKALVFRALSFSMVATTELLGRRRLRDQKHPLIG